MSADRVKLPAGTFKQDLCPYEIAPIQSDLVGSEVYCMVTNVVLQPLSRFNASLISIFSSSHGCILYDCSLHIHSFKQSVQLQETLIDTYDKSSSGLEFATLQVS